MYYPIRQTGRQNNWFRGTYWREELVKKQIRQTGRCNKWFQNICCGWKRSKQRSKCSYSHYQHNFNYSHYQRKFNTKIIDQPNHPSRLQTDNPARHRRCGGRVREFQPALDGSPTGKRHRHGAQLRAHFRTPRRVLRESPKFVDLGMSPAYTTDKLKSVIDPATRFGGLTDHSDWLVSRHRIAEVTEGTVSEVQAYSNYI